MLKQRLEQDFGVKLNATDTDQKSVISGLDDEIDEWAALNKYAVLRSYQENEEKKVAARDRQLRMREELEKQ